MSFPTKAFRFVIIGPPGSGKGTVADRIVRDFAFKKIATGDVLRNHVLNNTEKGREAKRYMDQGQLVPDSLMFKLVIEELKKVAPNSWLLDGYPRTISQAEALQKIEPVDVALNLVVPFDVIIERLRHRWIHEPSGRTYHTEFNPPKKPGFDDVTGEPLVQRSDDSKEVVTQRLQTFKNTFSQVMDYYRGLQLLKEFHGTETNKIWPKIHQFLTKYTENVKNP